jgi:predicted nucleic acid-binding protein
MIVFVDSSVLIEHLKGKNTLYLELLKRGHELCINAAVLSEFMYYFVGVLGDKSPLALKVSGQLPAVLSKHDAVAFLRLFSYLPDQIDFPAEVPKLMQQYNLLPNDSIILATCRHYGIACLATLDPDFKTPCR